MKAIEPPFEVEYKSKVVEVIEAEIKERRVF